MLSRLSNEQPPIESTRLAAVAVIIAGDDEPKTLLIERAEHFEDPWSGQIAFPGGKMSGGDKSAKETAIRETKEELSVDLGRDTSFAGYYDPFRTHTGSMDVIPAVFILRGRVKVIPNGEVSGYRWVSLSEFLQPRSSSRYRLEVGGFARDVPAFIIGDYVVWGLTHRIITSLLGSSALE